VYRDTVFGEEEIDNFVLIAGRVLVDELEYSLLRLKGYLTRAPLYTRVRRRHCSKAMKVDIQLANPLLV
jgi:hypothetical protein